MAECKDCGGRLRFAKPLRLAKPRGQAGVGMLPFDAEAVTVVGDHPLYRIYNFNGETRAEQMQDVRAFYGCRYTLHFDTCPKRKEPNAV